MGKKGGQKKQTNPQILFADGSPAQEPFPHHATEEDEEPVVNQKEHLVLGLEMNYVPDLVSTLRESQQLFDFIVTPLSHPRYERDLINENASKDPFTRSDMLLTSSQWGSLVTGKISTWLQLDSSIDSIRKNSERVLKQEIAWASHLNVPSVILPTPSRSSSNYANVINRTLTGGSYLQFWLRIPLVAGGESLLQEEDPWQHWNTFRSLCQQHPSLGVALEITENLPSVHELNRWKGEPVKAIIIPTSVFLMNKSGYPALSTRHKEFLIGMFRYKPQIILSGPAPTLPRDIPAWIDLYHKYILYVFNSNPPFTATEYYEVPYYDYLQAPLQPLQDNLESSTYETFERDAIKYRKYQEAIQKYLAKGDDPSRVYTVMVVGAGRGPLVRATLRASEHTGRAVKVYAVEKNPNAIITLKHMIGTDAWGGRVTLVDSDMRYWDAPEKADLFVSELLGSFGDNELSPECLDGVQRFLKDDGVMIPVDYTSYLTPITSSKLWNEVNSYKDLKHFETPYVVRLHNIWPLADAQPAFVFKHPNREHPIDNDRYIKLKFIAQEAGTIHGFAGYFDSVLYDDVHLSTNPANATKNMFSWFPIYFPFKDPVYCPKDAVVEIDLWRLSTNRKVWYEWSMASPTVTPIHNPNGRSYYIGL